MGWYWWVQAASRMAMARVMRVLSLGCGGGRSRRSGMGAPSHHGTASGRSRAGRGRPGTRGSGPRGGAVGLRMPAASWSGAFRAWVIVHASPREAERWPADAMVAVVAPTVTASRLVRLAALRTRVFDETPVAPREVRVGTVLVILGVDGREAHD